MGKIALICLGLFCIAYGLAGLGVPLGLVVPILALATGILIFVGK